MTSPSDLPRLGNVVTPVGDIESGIAFYEALGLAVKFADGVRFAAFDTGVPLVLVAGSEDITEGQVAASLKTADVDGAVVAALAAGGHVASAPADGPHERRAVLVDPWGNRFIVYAVLPAT